MKRRGMLALLLPLSVLLAATVIQATILPVVKTTAEPETTLLTQKTFKKLDTTAPSEINQPDAQTDKLPKDHIQHESKDAENLRLDATPTTIADESIMKELPKLARPILPLAETLHEEITKLNDLSDGADAEEVGKVLKAQAQRPVDHKLSSTVSSPVNVPEAKTTTDKGAAIFETAEADLYDEWNENEDNYNSQVGKTSCPEFCNCSGKWNTLDTARCSKLVAKPSGTDFVRLVIENANELTLGPHALRLLGFKKLKALEIINSTINKIDRLAFHGLDLSQCKMIGNRGAHIDHDIFQNNLALNSLEISDHSFPQEWFEAQEYLFDADGVTEFYFTRNTLGLLPPKAFKKMTHVSRLNLRGNQLFNIERANFEFLAALTELDLSENQLSALPYDLFEGKSLPILTMTHNLLTSLESFRANELLYLDVSHNHIKSIGKTHLNNLPDLQELVISSNGLERIHTHAFGQLKELRNLDITNNALTYFSKLHLTNNTMLEKVYMSGNPGLKTLPIFKSHNEGWYNIKVFECADCGLDIIQPGTFDTMAAMTTLNLAGNNLSGLPEDMFKSLLSLEKLNLSNNHISTIPANMFNGAGSLNFLTLSGNPLKPLQVTPFSQTSLMYLDVSYCNLRRVWDEARHHFKSLRFMSVRGNQLERITAAELKATPKLSYLDISQNPLLCDEEFFEAVAILRDNGVVPIEDLDYSSIDSLDTLGDYYQFREGSWDDLVKIKCEHDGDGIPARPLPKKPPTTPPYRLDNDMISEMDKGDDIEVDPMINPMDVGLRTDEFVEAAWSEQDKEVEYEELYEKHEYPWYTDAWWSVLTVTIIILSVLMIVIHFARFLANRRGRGPVIRPPMILRPGLTDNKNCGLVYKPLQEEIATPQPKRGSFYSSSTFHYDKIVPESV